MLEGVIAERPLAGVVHRQQAHMQRELAAALQRARRGAHQDLARRGVEGYVLEAAGIGDEVHPLYACERRRQAADHEVVARGNGAVDAAARTHAVFAQAQVFLLHGLEQRARDDRAHRAFSPGRAHRAAERHQFRELRGALVAAEEVLLERRLLLTRQIAEPVVDQRGELGAHARSMHTRSFPSARWRITRTLPALNPGSEIDSSKKLPMTTARSRSESASRHAASLSRSKTRGSASSSASSSMPYISSSAPRRAVPRKCSSTTLRQVPSTNEASRSGSRSFPARRRSSVIMSTCCTRSAAACRSRR